MISDDVILLDGPEAKPPEGFTAICVRFDDASKTQAYYAVRCAPNCPTCHGRSVVDIVLSCEDDKRESPCPVAHARLRSYVQRGGAVSALLGDHAPKPTPVSLAGKDNVDKVMALQRAEEALARAQRQMAEALGTHDRANAIRGTKIVDEELRAARLRDHADERERSIGAAHLCIADLRRKIAEQEASIADLTELRTEALVAADGADLAIVGIRAEIDEELKARRRVAHKWERRLAPFQRSVDKLRKRVGAQTPAPVTVADDVTPVAVGVSRENETL